MSRRLSPERASRLAERANKNAAHRLKEKRRTWLMVAGIAVTFIALMVADYFWLRHQAKLKHEQRHQQRSKLTNDPGQIGQNRATNHE